jgi:hypothetical protein
MAALNQDFRSYLMRPIDQKINYLTKINYHVRARPGRPKDDVGDIGEPAELAGVKSSNDY